MEPLVLISCSALLLYLLADLAGAYDLALGLKPSIIVPLVIRSNLGSNVFITLGLLISIFGDFYMEFPDQSNFLRGVTFFGLAQISYLTYFYYKLTEFHPITIIPYLIFGSIIRNRFKEHIDPRTLGYLEGYGLLLSVATIHAFNYTLQTGENKAFYGFMLFSISDLLITYDRYIQKLPYGKTWIMISYTAAQIYISCI